MRAGRSLWGKEKVHNADRACYVLHGQDMDKTQYHRSTIERLLAVGGGGRLAVGSWRRLAVGGSQGLSFRVALNERKKKSSQTTAVDTHACDPFRQRMFLHSVWSAKP